MLCSGISSTRPIIVLRIADFSSGVHSLVLFCFLIIPATISSERAFISDTFCLYANSRYKKSKDNIIVWFGHLFQSLLMRRALHANLITYQGTFSNWLSLWKAVCICLSKCHHHAYIYIVNIFTPDTAYIRVYIWWLYILYAWNYLVMD